MKKAVGKESEAFKNLKSAVQRNKLKDNGGTDIDTVVKTLMDNNIDVKYKGESGIKDTRPSKDEYYLGIADAVLKRSTCLRRKYGAVLVKGDEIVSTGYNGSPRGEQNCCDCGYCEREAQNIPKGERYELCVAIHAEDNAITSASRSKACGATLYIVGRNVADNSLANPAPCMMCRRKIVNAGIARVVGLVDGKPQDLDISKK